MRYKVFSLLLTTFALAAWTPSAEAETVGYWRFEEGLGLTAIDSSGNANDGSLLNGTLFSADVPVVSIPLSGEANLRALSFDGLDDIVVVPDSGSLRPSGAITIEAWAKPSSGARVIIGKQLFGGCCVNSYQLELNPFRFQLTDTSGNDHLIQGALVPSPGQWHHVAGTWDGATMRLYLDGLEVASGGFSGPIGYDANPVLIGGEDDGHGIPGCCLFQGLVDEVRISDQALGPQSFLLADRCGERLDDCLEDLAACEGDLEAALADVEGCQSDLSDALADLAGLNDLLALLEAEIARIEGDLQQTFNDPDFRIPGATTLERHTNLTEAILGLPRCGKLLLYRNLGGR